MSGWKCQNCGLDVPWSFPRPEDACIRCGKPIGRPAPPSVTRDDWRDDHRFALYVLRGGELTRLGIYADDEGGLGMAIVTHANDCEEDGRKPERVGVLERDGRWVIPMWPDPARENA